MWYTWSEKLGLFQNVAKTRFVAATKSKKTMFLSTTQTHNTEEFVKDDAEVLGCISSALPRAPDQKEFARVQKTMVSKRVAILPVSRNQRIIYCKMYAVLRPIMDG